MKFDHKKEKKNLPLLNIFCQKHCFESFVAFKQLIESSFISAETLKYITSIKCLNLQLGE